MKKYNWLLLLCFSLIAIVLTSSLAIECARAAPKPIILKTHVHMAKDNDLVKGYAIWCDMVTERTGGRVQFEHYYSQALAKSKEQLPALKSGLFDIGGVHVGYHPSTVPLWQVTELPLSITSNSTTLAKASTELAKMPLLQDELTKQNVKLLITCNPGGPRWLVSSKPVYSVKDLKGLKVREKGGFAKVYEQLGASPVSIGVPDVYDAIAKGTLNGFSGTIAGSVSYGFYEVCDYFITMSVGASGGRYMINLDSWNKLPADIQKIILETSADFENQIGSIAEKNIEKSFAALKAKGMTIIDFPKAEQDKVDQVAAVIASDWEKDMNAKGYPGTEVLNVWTNALKKYMK